MKTFDRKSFALHCLYIGATAIAAHLLANIEGLRGIVEQHVSPTTATIILSVVAAALKKIMDYKDLNKSII
jgi:hypothetical protein